MSKKASKSERLDALEREAKKMSGQIKMLLSQQKALLQLLDEKPAKSAARKTKSEAKPPRPAKVVRQKKRAAPQLSVVADARDVEAPKLVS